MLNVTKLPAKVRPEQLSYDMRLDIKDIVDNTCTLDNKPCSLVMIKEKFPCVMQEGKKLNTHVVLLLILSEILRSSKVIKGVKTMTITINFYANKFEDFIKDVTASMFISPEHI